MWRRLPAMHSASRTQGRNDPRRGGPAALTATIPRRDAGDNRAGLGMLGREVADPVDLPGLAAVGGEGLFHVGVGLADAGPLVAHQDHAAVPGLHVVELEEPRP